MKITNIIIQDSQNKNKRLTAKIFIQDSNKPLVRHFGSKNAYTFFDGADDTKRNNYIKRHSKNNENWQDITTPGALSRYVLWSLRNQKNIQTLIKQKFNIPNVSINISKKKSQNL